MDIGVAKLDGLVAETQCSHGMTTAAYARLGVAASIGL
jgi:hypothetical protein